MQTLETLFDDQLSAITSETNLIEELRIAGLMIGIELTIEGAPIVQECQKRGLLINCTQGNVLRLLPAMNLSEEEAKQGCEILADALTGFENS